MLTMGIDIGSRSSKCVILDDGQLLTYGNIETGPDIVKTTHAVVQAAVQRETGLWGECRMPLPDVKVDHLKIDDMACIVSTGYGVRRGALRRTAPSRRSPATAAESQWFVPGVATVLDVGGQDSKGIRVARKARSPSS